MGVCTCGLYKKTRSTTYNLTAYYMITLVPSYQKVVAITEICKQCQNVRKMEILSCT